MRRSRDLLAAHHNESLTAYHPISEIGEEVVVSRFVQFEIDSEIEAFFRRDLHQYILQFALLHVGFGGNLLVRREMMKCDIEHVVSCYVCSCPDARGFIRENQFQDTCHLSVCLCFMLE